MKLIVRTFKEFVEDDCPRMAAALAYYTVFALPPLLVLIMLTAGVFLSPDELMTWMERQMGSEQAGAQLETMFENARERLSGGLSITLLLSVLGLLFSATGAFAQFQKALNTAWDVQPDPEKKGKGKILHIVLKRLLSLGMIVVIGFLLVVALTVSGMVAAFSEQISAYLISLGVPATLAGIITWGADPIVFLAVLWALFGAIFMLLPDARLAWRHVRVGALVTAVLFVIGKMAVGLYVGQSSPGSAFGAAGALAVILVFVYYASMIVLLGAEFTQVWSQRHGEHIAPSRHAVKVVEEKHFVRDGDWDQLRADAKESRTSSL